MWKIGREKEKWEDLAVFYVPEGTTNKPWELNGEIFNKQFEVSKIMIHTAPFQLHDCCDSDAYRTSYFPILFDLADSLYAGHESLYEKERG